MTMELLEQIELVRLLIGDIPSSPFYPLYQDEEIEQFLKLSNNNIMKAAIYAAHGASMMFAGYTTMEKTGDITVRNELSSNYLKALRLLIDSNKDSKGEGVYFPWSNGISVRQVCEYLNNPTVTTSPLLKVFACDSDKNGGKDCNTSLRNVCK